MWLSTGNTQSKETVQFIIWDLGGETSSSQEDELGSIARECLVQTSLDH